MSNRYNFMAKYYLLFVVKVVIGVRLSDTIDFLSDTTDFFGYSMRAGGSEKKKKIKIEIHFIF